MTLVFTVTGSSHEWHRVSWEEAGHLVITGSKKRKIKIIYMHRNFYYA